MTSSEKITLCVAVISILGSTTTAILSGKFQADGTRAQIEKDVHLVQLQSVEQKEKLVREKYEALVVELSDLISYFDANNHFPVAEAKQRIAKCRRAAFALSAHADSALSFAGLASVEVVNQALAPSATGQPAATSREIEIAAKKLSEEFRIEMNSLYSKRLELMRYSLGHA